MNWIIILDVIYVIILVLVCLRIVYDTSSTTKTLAYLLLVVFIPIAGMLFYFSFGINYRKRVVYSKKLIEDDVLRQELIKRVISTTAANLRKNNDVGDGTSLVHLLLKDSLSPLTSGNKVKLLLNGEEKFPEVFEVLKNAKHHIHLEYYIYDDDVIGNKVKDVLIQKAAEGVQVRFIYDAFGSRSIRRKFLAELRASGVEAYPFNRIRFLPLANRLNYRNHRKIIIVDGNCGFVGGINISDRYINDKKNPHVRFWRDTHVRIDGPGVQYLQYLFFCDWNFCAQQKMQPEPVYFNRRMYPDDISVQIAASGPDSPTATVMFSLLKAINLAKNEILIATPYFIPGETILNALKIAALGGVSVKILAPGISDSRLVNAAAWSYYGDLLRAGVEIYLYQKGFIHVKTLVVDDYISIVGTANMDYRSFDLNFEVNAVVYGEELAGELRKTFADDLKDAQRIQPEAWRKRPWYKQLPERIARLLSPLL
jgi:cardiolipin synthase